MSDSQQDQPERLDETVAPPGLLGRLRRLTGPPYLEYGMTPEQAREVLPELLASLARQYPERVAELEAGRIISDAQELLRGEPA